MFMRIVNILFFIAVAALGFLFVLPAFAGSKVTPEEAMKRLDTGNAVLIDVREPSEWSGGVVESAVLLSLSDLQKGGSGWTEFLRQHKDRELVLYCRSGNRSGIAARILEKQGFHVSNAGAFSAWVQSGAPTRKP
jgi:rhodanese-related sulfurtransferase